MSGGVQPSMFFLGLPLLEKLVCISLTLQEDEDPRSRQIETCRELVLLYSDLLASPALDSFSDITVVVSIPFFQSGVLQAFGQRRSLQLGCPQCVSPGVLQCCLSYSLITRLAPSWNKAGLYLISGKDFLSESGRLNAVGMELSTSEGQLCLSIEANTVRLPPTRLEDFDLPPLVLRRFCSNPDSVLDPASTGGALWCHVLPSMKKGQIITITRKLPRDGPFRTYRDLQNHWNRLYGYRLPELPEEEVVYCSIYFRLVGQRLFTYPLSCVRLQPVQRCPRVDLQGALGSFLSDVRDRLHAVCGFPARLTGKPRYHTAGLRAAAALQVLGGEQINLSSSSSSIIRPVLTQLPPPPPPRPVKLSFGSQPPAWTPLSQQDGAPGLLGNGAPGLLGNGAPGLLGNGAPGLLGNGLTQSQVCRGDRDWPSSSSSSSSRVSFSHPLVYQSAHSFSSSSSSSSSSLSLLSHTSSSSSSSSSSSRVSFSQPLVYQSALSFSSSSSSSSSSLSLLSHTSSSVLPPLPPPTQTQMTPAPQLVPIFRNRCPSRHVNVALLRLQKQREQLIGGGGERGRGRGRVTLPAFRTKTPAAASSSSVSSLSAAPPRPLPLPLPVPRFNRRPKPPQPAGHPGLKRLTSLSPASKSRPGFLLAPKTEIMKPKSSSKTTVKSRSDRNPAANSGKVKTKRPPAAPPSDISNKRPATPPTDISNKRPPAAPPSDVSNKRPAAPPSAISNKRPATPPTDISNKRPPAAPPSDISNKRPAAPPSAISNKRPPAAPPSAISNKRPATPPTDISNKRPPAAPPSDVSNKRPPAAPPSDISNKRPPAAPPSDISNKRPPAAPPTDISNKRPPAAPPTDISNKRPPAAPPTDISNKRPAAPPSAISNKRPPSAPPSAISNKRPAAPPSDASSSRRGVVFESKPKKPRSAVRDVDVGQMARSNQLSQLNSATLLFWLKGRGVLVSTKHRKEDLMLKVMGCLAEA